MPDIIKIAIYSAYDSTMNGQTKSEEDPRFSFTLCCASDAEKHSRASQEKTHPSQMICACGSITFALNEDAADQLFLIRLRLSIFIPVCGLALQTRDRTINDALIVSTSACVTSGSFSTACA